MFILVFLSSLTVRKLVPIILNIVTWCIPHFGYLFKDLSKLPLLILCLLHLASRCPPYLAWALRSAQYPYSTIPLEHTLSSTWKGSEHQAIFTTVLWVDTLLTLLKLHPRMPSFLFLVLGHSLAHSHPSFVPAYHVRLLTLLFQHVDAYLAWFHQIAFRLNCSGRGGKGDERMKGKRE